MNSRSHRRHPANPIVRHSGNFRLKIHTLFLTGALACVPILSAEEALELPDLNKGGSSLMSEVQEKALGQAWLRSFRSAVPLEQDPQIYEYAEALLMKLASNSELDNKELDLVVVRNATINAFAVPGGIVGLHTGLILSAETEGQLASVLGHELAHLSQHHFARSVEAARRANVANLTGMLAGIILAATAGGDAATAAIATSQAAAIDSRLRYSRLHEREADRLGMKTLVQSGYNPDQAAAMFRKMLDASRLYGSSVPEFLRTHPVTQSRIADAENRARQTGETGKSDTLDFQLIKTRSYVLSVENSVDAVKHYQRALENHTDGKETDGDGANNSSRKLSDTEKVARYGLALAYNESGDWKKARKTLDPLLQDINGKLSYSLLDIAIDAKAKRYEIAERRLRDLYLLTPGSYSIGMALADVSLKTKHYSSAQQVLNQLAKQRPKQADVWYLLAEVNGLAGDIVELHQARAEFFMLRNNLGQAKFHLNYALKIAADDFKRSANIKQRLRYLNKLQQQQRRSS